MVGRRSKEGIPLSLNRTRTCARTRTRTRTLTRFSYKATLCNVDVDVDVDVEERRAVRPRVSVAHSGSISLWQQRKAKQSKAMHVQVKRRLQPGQHSNDTQSTTPPHL